MKSKWIMTTLLSLGLGLYLAPALQAAEEEHHEQGEEAGPEETPDTVSGIWHEVKEHEAELAKVIADKQLSHVHHIAFSIRDYVNALPEKSKDLAADKLAQVTANARFVAQLAERLDESGDANDQAATEANFQKLQGILKSMEAQYPPDMLQAGEDEESEDD